MHRVYITLSSPAYCPPWLRQRAGERILALAANLIEAVDRTGFRHGPWAHAMKYFRFWLTVSNVTVPEEDYLQDWMF